MNSTASDLALRKKLEHPSSDLGIIVVIPAFNETSLIPTIASLLSKWKLQL